ncbi:COP1-interacting protein-related, putative isoform 3 [Hibiscus syriacus]|uniref:COP1-interacting protein-related, putative isoform 3 n=1 Tax=Hibiscus syriacus TaxID=106335 RepID=A0A6A2Y5K1_HIBSY|nr:COP1-interacting protein 7-like [Hibiscus syriacus]KAE8667989.1 COP1-interacting protein-related, putative isoform 3 [Hibiscus syriacus]
MKSSARLDSVVFQLTPTRTRCDLVISANGKTEKMASGLLNPFLAHLKTAQEQMTKGGYSIILQPDPTIDASWFTKGTVERFVRFVSTPDILERVYTVESEILQIEEAIAIQSNNTIGLSAVEEHQVKPAESAGTEGSRAKPDSNDEKAIVLYSPNALHPEANSSSVEGNSKAQLLKVLETRKTVLHKEQSMAFARAVAAGFDIDHVAPLISFAETFGASRFKDACIKFNELRKRKHETGQWLEIEAAEAMSCRSDFPPMNATGIVFSENNGKSGVESSIDEKPPMDQQTPSRQEYYQSQYPHPMFPPWPIHSPPGGMPPFQGYPMQGMPYYPNYPGGSPFFQQPYPSMEDPRNNVGKKIQKRHSMDSRESHSGSDTWEIGRANSQDNEELGNENSPSSKSIKKSSKSSKKKSGMVVIRNINYITSKRESSSGSDSQSHSCSEEDVEDGDTEHKNSQRSSKVNGSRTKSVDAYDREETVNGKETDGGHWQAFQTYLLRDAEDEERRTDREMFSTEKEVQGKRRPNQVRGSEDPLVFGGREMGQFEEGNATDMHEISASGSRMPKGSNDQSSTIGRGDHTVNDGRIFIDREMNGKRVYRRNINNEFIVDRQQNLSDFANSPSDPQTFDRFEHSSNGLERRSSNNINDDSYIVPFRSTSGTQVGTDDRSDINMDYDFSLSLQKAENIPNGIGSQVNYEPDDLTLMPERGAEMGSIGYDPALDYEMQSHVEDGTSPSKKNNEGMQGSKKCEKDRKLKLIADPSDKKKAVGPIRRGKLSKLSPLDEAKVRAERLRTYKADLQKLKKEKEEAEIKRLEALKMERQKRIAARGGSVLAQSSVAAQSSKHLPSKLSPSSHKASKFTYGEPGPSSPLQRSIKPASVGSAGSHKVSKPSKLNTGTPSRGNRLSQSVSSLPEPKKDNGGVTPDTKTSMARIRRLSEPKTISSPLVSSVRSRHSEPSKNTKASGVPESKKISAIVNHDMSKIASLPELKIKTTKSPDVTSGKLGGNEMTQKVTGSISSTTDVTESSRNKEEVSLHTDGDDSTVVEKTVVMLESFPAVNSSEGTTVVKKENDGIFKIRRKTETVSDYAVIHAPVSSLNPEALDKEQQVQQKQRAYEVQKANVSDTEKELSEFTSTSVTEKQYQAPLARISSMEDPCTKISEYVRAPPASMPAATTNSENVRALVADTNNLRLEKIPEVLDRPQVKDSSKGFRRLLKFGKKNHSSARSEHSIDSSGEAEELVPNAASSSEVHLLKNLISQDETPTADTTPQKSSRSFSMLSPFRSKTSEKKHMA